LKIKIFIAKLEINDLININMLKIKKIIAKLEMSRKISFVSALVGTSAV